ncbi:transposase [Streptomyces erythrochromogenes]|uniref:transposase n=1 Tax=Streptomyces erythrochromogenes TaxID=285574 RepID=UPI0036B8ADB8
MRTLQESRSYVTGPQSTRRRRNPLATRERTQQSSGELTGCRTICDGRGTPLKVITTAANVNDVTQTLALVDGIPPVAGRPGRPRRRPEALLGDKGYDSNPNRDELRKRRILPVISRKGAPNIKGMGPLRRRADLRPAPPVQTTRRPMGTPHRTPRRLPLPRLQPHLLATPQQARRMIVLRALRSTATVNPPSDCTLTNHFA